MKQIVKKRNNKFRINKKFIFRVSLIIVILTLGLLIYSWYNRIHITESPFQIRYPEEQLVDALIDNTTIKWHPDNKSLIAVKQTADGIKLHMINTDEASVKEIEVVEIYESFKDINKDGLIRKESLLFTTQDGLVIYNPTDENSSDIYYLLKSEHINQAMLSEENKLNIIYEQEAGNKSHSIYQYDLKNNKYRKIRCYPDRLFNSSNVDMLYFTTMKNDIKLNPVRLYDLWRLEDKKFHILINKAYSPIINTENIAYFKINNKNMSLWVNNESSGNSQKIQQWEIDYDYSVHYMPHMSWIPDSNTLIFAVPNKDSNTSVYSYDLDTNSKRTLISDKNIIGPMSLSSEGEFLLYYESIDNIVNTFIFKMDTKKITNITDFVP